MGSFETGVCETGSFALGFAAAFSVAFALESGPATLAGAAQDAEEEAKNVARIAAVNRCQA